jgi:hypothetical protein
MSPHRRRSRNCLLAALAVIALGLASRHWPALFPAVFGKYPGDALWALMVFYLLGALMPRLSTARLGAYALAISFIDEFSQLYQAPWIDAIRATTPGHLVLGSAFGWGDLGAYVVGVAAGVTADRVFLRKNQARSSSATASAAMPSSRPR